MEEDWDEEIRTGVPSVANQANHSYGGQQSTNSRGSERSSYQKQDHTRDGRDNTQRSGGRYGFEHREQPQKSNYGRHSENTDWRQSHNDHSNSSDWKSSERPRASDRGHSWRQQNGDDRDRSDSSHDDAHYLTVDNKYIGCIIGKGGSKIRELEEKSGARLKILPQEGDEEERKIRISGPSSSREEAKLLISDVMQNANSRDSSDRYSRNNTSSGYGDRSFSRDSRNDTSSSNDRSYTQHSSSNDYALSGDNNFQFIDWANLIQQSDKEREKRWAKFPKIVKNFYYESQDVAAMHPEEVAAFRLKNNNIAVSFLDEDDDRPIPNPVKAFEQAFAHYPEILEEIYKQKFTTPSPIQSQAWPILLQGYDMIGIAQTGTGKTLAFLLPALIHIDNQVTPRKERSGPTCVVMAPTRELAQQIEKEAKKYQFKGIKCVCIYGGGSRREQINIVTGGVEIVIATPGRLNDLVMNNFIDLSYVTYLVLDEADRMLDMGFEPQIRKILLDIRPDRQTVMTSATWPEGVRRLANQYMSKPFQVCVGSLDLAAVHTVSQTILLVDESEKRDYLVDFLASMEPDEKVIVFVDKKAMVDHIASDFALEGIECQSIHGSREQCDREQALEDLRDGTVRILIATDVAARGLDIKDITHIYNYDFPRNIEEYVHRVGRTGRAGRTGKSITLVTRGDWKQARELINILEEAEQPVPQELYGMADRFEKWKQTRDEEQGSLRRFGGRGRRNDRW